ncbi:MAG: helicase-related protein [Spirosomataceae bacterium]
MAKSQKSKLSKRKEVEFGLSIIRDETTKRLLSAIGSGAGKIFVEAYFKEVENKIRIASSYFNLKGYEIGDRNIGEKEIEFNILVGSHGHNKGQDAKEVQRVILSSIKQELKECGHNWAIAIESLVNRIKNNSILIKEARETKKNPMFHNKFYIIDEKIVFQGSANFSGSGLQSNSEQLNLIEQKEIIENYIIWYDKIIAKSRDLKGDLLKILNDWLNLSQPFDIYLKIIHILNTWTGSDIKKYQPNYYQKAVIQSAYKQIEQYGGSLVVAATGLGKTIIGSEIAYKLQNIKKNKRAIVIAPPNVHSEWEKQLELRDINNDVFGITVLFNEDSEKEKDNHQIAKLKRKLDMADEFTTIIIDEVHRYKNQKVKEKTDNKVSSVYQRLTPAVSRGANILLLTATPYASNTLNVDSILYLLPHNADSTDLFKGKEAWQVNNDINQFISLPVVTIIGLPHVLKLSKERNDIDVNGRIYVKFGDEKRYFPKQIKVIPAQYELFLKDELEPLFTKGLFSQKSKFNKATLDDETIEAINSKIDILYNQAIIGWLSSPFALKWALEQNISTDDADYTDLARAQLRVFPLNNMEKKIDISKKNEGYSITLKHSQSERIEQLSPILNILTESNFKDDKYKKLLQILEDRYEEKGSKILIFVERYQTAIYLFDLLKEKYSQIVTSTVEAPKDEDSVPKLINKHRRDQNTKSFSPKANDYKTDKEYEILICTDADGVGINLQDCDTIINYDLPQTADSLFQRLGRILRMTKNSERVIYFYSLIPDFVHKSDLENASQTMLDLINPFKRLTKRHNRSKNILGTAIMSENGKEEIINLDDEKIWLELSQAESIIKSHGESEAESQLSHLAIYDKYKDKVNFTMDLTHSCMTYNDKDKRIVILFKMDNNYNLISYNISKETLEHKKSNVAILNMIACKKETAKYPTPASEIEKYANSTMSLWCITKNVVLENIEKLCVILLLPNDKINTDKVIQKFVYE